MKLFSALLGFSQASAFYVNEHVEGYCKATGYVNAHPGTEYINTAGGKRFEKFAGIYFICGLNKPFTFVENVFVISGERAIFIINGSP